MLIDILVKFVIKLMEFYSAWIPNWSMPDGLIDAFTLLITYSSYVGVFINTGAFYGAMKMVFETIIIIMIIKAVAVFISTLRGSNSQI